MACVVEVRAGFHCTVSAHLISGPCRSVRAELTHGLCRVCYSCLSSTSLAMGRQGEASKALERQGGNHDMMGNMQKQQDF